MLITNIQRQDILTEVLKEPGVIIVCYYQRNEQISGKLLRELEGLRYHPDMAEVSLFNMREDRVDPKWFKTKGIATTPVLCFYRNGVEITRMTGFSEETYIRRAVADLFPMPLSTVKEEMVA